MLSLPRRILPRIWLRGSSSSISDDVSARTGARIRFVRRLLSSHAVIIAARRRSVSRQNSSRVSFKLRALRVYQLLGRYLRERRADSSLFPLPPVLSDHPRCPLVSCMLLWPTVAPSLVLSLKILLLSVSLVGPVIVDVGLSPTSDTDAAITDSPAYRRIRILVRVRVLPSESVAFISLTNHVIELESAECTSTIFAGGNFKTGKREVEFSLVR